VRAVAPSSGRYALFLDRLGRYEPAATIAGFAYSPLTAAWTPEISTAIAHMRDVLGDQTYESLARKGETMLGSTADAEALEADRLEPPQRPRSRRARA
jgi:hypothetical protein